MELIIEAGQKYQFNLEKYASFGYKIEGLKSYNVTAVTNGSPSKYGWFIADSDYGRGLYNIAWFDLII